MTVTAPTPHRVASGIWCRFCGPLSPMPVPRMRKIRPRKSRRRRSPSPPKVKTEKRYEEKPLKMRVVGLALELAILLPKRRQLLKLLSQHPNCFWVWDDQGATASDGPLTVKSATTAAEVISMREVGTFLLAAASQGWGGASTHTQRFGRFALLAFRGAGGRVMTNKSAPEEVSARRNRPSRRLACGRG